MSRSSWHYVTYEWNSCRKAPLQPPPLPKKNRRNGKTPDAHSRFRPRVVQYESDFAHFRRVRKPCSRWARKLKFCSHGGFPHLNKCTKFGEDRVSRLDSTRGVPPEKVVSIYIYSYLYREVRPFYKCYNKRTNRDRALKFHTMVLLVILRVIGYFKILLLIG